MNTVDMNVADQVVQADLADICERLNDEFSQMAGHNLLITGGAGFLGYYLVQAVVHWNEQQASNRSIPVTVFDNFSRGRPDWLLELGDAVHLVKHDVRHPLPTAMVDFPYVIHGASIASPTFYRKDPIATMDANVNGLRRLLDYFHSQNEAGRPAEGFLFFSSSEIYGDPPPADIPTNETYRGYVSCTGPRACYDEAKRYGETLCVNFAQMYGLPVKCARPFNNYGPGLKITDRRAPPDFARDVINGRDIVMYSDGTPSRTFCYSADAIVGYYKILVRGRSGEAYNIGADGPEVSMADYAEMVVATARELFGYSGSVKKHESDDADYLIDNPNRRCPDITKARTELGYDPQISLEEGVRRSLLWYSGNNLAADE
jgi:nucleoside-diphosphate-sugar epimerase